MNPVVSAAALLDAVARKHSGCAFIREITTPDEDLLAIRDHCREVGDYSTYPETSVWGRRIDGLLLDGGRTRTAIEVKVSRSDFARENDAKRAPWRRITHRFVYVTPVGLLRPNEIPEGCGLWEVDDNGCVRVRVRARINRAPAPIPHQVLVTLAYRLNRLDARS